MKAIDTHVHFSTERGSMPRDPKYAEIMDRSFHLELGYKTEEQMAQDFTSLDVKAILMPIDAETARGYKASNDYAAEVVRKFPEAFLGSFAAIDPWKGQGAVKELERAVKELGMMGVKFQQCIQEFFPNDPRFYPIYEKALELKVPVLFHTGGALGMAGIPGGGGMHLKYAEPIYIDDVAADFPELTIIAAHPSWPWTDQSIAIALHKGNVVIDLSGWAPKYWPEALRREVNGRLQDKALYGSDYPAIPPRRWLEEFTSGGYKPEVIEKVLYKNAMRVFNLER